MSALAVILLVEDSDDDAELTTLAFAQARIENPIVRARDGVEALDYLFGRGPHASRDTSQLPAVILLDLHLPRVGGLDVLRELRSDARTTHVPVVVLTSSEVDQERLSAYVERANSFVQKPVGFDAFLRAVRELGLYWALLNRPAPGERARAQR